MSHASTRISRRMNAPRERVYRALLDPQAVATWMVPAGMTSHVHEFDARKGGRFRISLTYDQMTGTGKTTAQTDTYHGHFLELIPDEKVVEALEFETADPAMRGEMTVTFTLTDWGGGTDVLAVHHSLPPGLSPADNETGWRMALDKLAALVAGTPQYAPAHSAESRKDLIVSREEQPRDLTAIREVHRRAFGQNQEAHIVDALRENGAVVLSLVATLGDRVVGHVMYSPALAGGVAGAALGPMAVLPTHQRQGIGSSLIEEGTRSLTEAGCPFIVVIGHAGYYPRFGFAPARAHGLTCEWDVPEDVFMILVLDEAKTARVSGLVKYRPEFSRVE